MTDQIVNLATRIFSYTFPNCQALFAFDNAANHACFAENALLAKKMNLDVDAKQPRIRDEFNNAIQQTQPIVFPDNHSNNSVQNKPQRLKQILTERSLWRKRAPNDCSFLLEIFNKS